MSKCSIKNLLKDNKLLQTAKNRWNKIGQDQKYLGLLCIKEELEKEVGQFEKKLTDFLNTHAKITQITAYSKQWWNDEVVEARKIWAKNGKRLGKNEDHKQEREKRNFGLVKSYRVISLLNCIGKVIEKVVAKELF